MDWNALVEPFLEFGVIGVVVIALAVVSYKLYCQKDAQAKQHHKDYVDLIAKQSKVAAELRETLAQMSTTQARLVEAALAMGHKLDALLRDRR
jgi:hypothetical protein